MTEVISFGCRLNAAESEVLRAHTAPLADTVVINTCAVTLEAERDARRAIRRLHRMQPGTAIVVTGCAATIDPASWQALPGVARVVGNPAKLRPETWGASAAKPPLRERTRAFIDVQGGCDHRCTFCIIPLGRGPARSVPGAAAVDAVRRAVSGGVREVVLTGVDLTSYGSDLSGAPTLGALVQDVLAHVPELPRLRLSSLDPAAIDPALWDALGTETRLQPHLHLSIQAGSDLILKRMRRRHRRADVVAAVNRARVLRPGIAIGADLIAGFPTETEAQFTETLALVEEAELPYLHVFPYSERPGTPAARMPPVPPAERQERAARLRAAGASGASRFHAGLLGHTAQVLVERGGAGHTEHFAPVRIDRAPGELVGAKIVAVEAGWLRAEAA